jgi:hypothetical protein
MPKPFYDKSESELDLWADTALKDLVSLVMLEIENPIEELFGYLKSVID